MVCAICHTRRPKRFCPAVRAEICPLCCGTEREVSLTCPFECEFLQEARRRDRPVPLTEADLPHTDIQVTEKFVTSHEELLVFLGQSLFQAAMQAEAVDYDVREALEGLIRTYRTLQTGMVYESLPANAIAAAVFRALQAAVDEFRRQEQQSAGMIRTRDTDILGLLVFLRRVELDRNNGRKRGRAFLDSLRGFYSAVPSADGSVLIAP
jgi:hypothetical protein